MELYTTQLAKWRLARERNIELIDITVKSGDPLFAPEPSVLWAYKRGDIDEEEYTRQYVSKMRDSYYNNTQHWLDLLRREKVVIACYCATGKFCHRHLLVEYLNKVANLHEIQFIYKGELTKEAA